MAAIVLIEWFVALVLLIVGLSHLTAPREWAALFTALLEQPWGTLIVGMWTLPFGVVLIVGHNIWRPDLGLVVTLLGWAWTIKGSFYLVMPDVPRRLVSGLAHGAVK